MKSRLCNSWSLYDQRSIHLLMYFWALHGHDSHAGVTIKIRHPPNCAPVLIDVISGSHWQEVYRVLNLNSKAPYASVLHNKDSACRAL